MFLPDPIKNKINNYLRELRRGPHFWPIIRRERVALRLARQQYEHFYAGPDEAPLVSIVILTYNRAELLVERAIKSALNQTYQNFEIIVVGDHCTDDTEERLRQVNNSRIRFYNLPERGPYPDDPKDFWRVAGVYARNKATELVRGKWIAPLDDDVIFTSDHVETLLRYAQANQLELVMSKAKAEKETGEWAVEGVSLLTFGQGGPFLSAPCVSIFRTYLYKVFPADMNTLQTDWAADAHLYWRMYKADVKAGFVDKVLLISPLRPGITVRGWRAEDLPTS
jgi:glycosyltransferase involved in cell wall biosynthesis